MGRGETDPLGLSRLRIEGLKIAFDKELGVATIDLFEVCSGAQALVTSSKPAAPEAALLNKDRYGRIERV